VAGPVKGGVYRGKSLTSFNRQFLPPSLRHELKISEFLAIFDNSQRELSIIDKN
jgi:hypothetical protein